MKNLKVLKNNKNQKEYSFIKTHEKKNELIGKLNTFVPFIIKKGKKKKVLSLLNNIVKDKKKYQNNPQFNQIKFNNLDEIINSTVPYVNTINLKTSKRNKSNSKIQTLPIKKSIQQRLQASWIFKSTKNINQSISFDQKFLTELKSWETNKEKFLQERNVLYKSALQSQEEDDE